MSKYGESTTTRITMATVPHVTSGSGFRKFQADGFLFDRVYVGCSFPSLLFFFFHMISPTDLLHPSPAPYFKTFKISLIYLPKPPIFSAIKVYASSVAFYYSTHIEHILN